MRLRCAILLALLAPLCGCGYRRAVIAEDHLAAGSAYVAKEAWNAARREFAAAAAARPKSAALEARIGLTYDQAGRCREAIPWLRRALERQPRQPWPVPAALITCLERAGRSDEAEQVLRDALVTYRDNAIALNNIGYMAADRGVHLEEAARLLRRALALAPEAGFILDSLGWCYFRQGRLDDALELLGRAARSETGNAEVRYHLGMVEQALGDTRAAAAEFGAALSLDPTFTRAYQALTGLGPGVAPPPAPAPTPTPTAPLMEQ